ncbi:NUDIX domain-containing protein [Mesobacillus foraminis]|uniref:NUDIX domain-containing protein n=1 Tax=Mesobacillus foraminis TaxID=279826 RepID=UPI0039A01844
MNVTGLFLGGEFETAEEAKESIKREFLEELNVAIAVNRLVWIAENFFEYNGMDIHELGLYFSVSSNHDPYAINSTPFYGMEGERLMYKWTPIEEIGNVELYPEFLRGEMSLLPNDPQHVVQR